MWQCTEEDERRTQSLSVGPRGRGRGIRCSQRLPDRLLVLMTFSTGQLGQQTRGLGLAAGGKEP